MATLARAAGRLDPHAKNPDHLAARLLAPRLKLVLAPGVRHVVRLAYELSCPGLYMFVQARTHAFDRVLRERLGSELDQLVVLGAGYDTRAYRFADSLATASIVEVDLRATQVGKQAALARAGIDAARVSFLATDLTREPLDTALARAGIDSRRRTLFLWEGVTPYLPESAVRATLDFVGRGAPGTAIVFDYLYRRAFDQPDAFRGVRGLRRVMERRREPWLFALDPEDLPRFVEASGLSLVRDEGPAELARYVELGPTRAMLGFGGVALAVNGRNTLSR